MWWLKTHSHRLFPCPVLALHGCPQNAQKSMFLIRLSCFQSVRREAICLSYLSCLVTNQPKRAGAHLVRRRQPPASERLCEGGVRIQVWRRLSPGQGHRGRCTHERDAQKRPEQGARDVPRRILGLGCQQHHLTRGGRSGSQDTWMAYSGGETLRRHKVPQPKKVDFRIPRRAIDISGFETRDRQEKRRVLRSRNGCDTRNYTPRDKLTMSHVSDGCDTFVVFDPPSAKKRRHMKMHIARAHAHTPHRSPAHTSSKPKNPKKAATAPFNTPAAPNGASGTKLSAFQREKAVDVMNTTRTAWRER